MSSHTLKPPKSVLSKTGFVNSSWPLSTRSFCSDTLTSNNLKNRYNDLTVNKRFVIGIDRAKMRLFDVKSSEQKDLVDSGQEDFTEPVFDNTDFGGFKVWLDKH